jgi:hypothetical protein
VRRRSFCRPCSFTQGDGDRSVFVTSFFLAGTNHVQIIINNTGNGIYGSITPSTKTNPTAVGLRGKFWCETATTDLRGSAPIAQGLRR